MRHSFLNRWLPLVLVCVAGLLFSVSAYAAEPGAAAAPVTAKVEIAASLVLQGNMPGGAGPYTFTLTAQDAANPMPAGASDGVKTVTQAGAGDFSFGSITFPKVGEYHYTIRQTPGNLPDCRYDTRVYTATVYVQWQAEVAGALQATLVLGENGNPAKPAAVQFTTTGSAPDAAGPATTPPPPQASAAPTGVGAGGPWLAPQTGDAANIALLFWALVASATGLLALAILRAKRKS
ncbi:MAG: FctA domain-containing protein [Gemmiger sp.]|nr:FctA domain-containing protein [Gemmiger sp.]